MDNKTWRELFPKEESRIRTPRESLKYEVHLTEHCNLNCKSCFHYSSIAEKDFLDVDEYELIWSMGVLISDNPRAIDVSKNIEKIITDPKCKKVMAEAGKELKDK